MTDSPLIVFTALLILGYGIFSRRAESSIVTAPMVFALAGLLVSFLPIEIVRDGTKAPYVKILAELTLIVVLFIDASLFDWRKVIKERNLPMRLLFIGLPLTMMLGALIAIPLFPGVNIWILVLMALILSPTDAALGVAVVTSKLVPEKIRQAINVESGLNDGLAFPPFLICLAVLSGTSHDGMGTAYWVAFVLKQFIYGPVIGGLVGWLGGLLIEFASHRKWMSHTFQRLASVSLAIIAYCVAESVYGNGFIAAFFAGLFLGTRSEEIRIRVQEFGEAQCQVLILFIFLLFGMLLVPQVYIYWDWQSLFYAVLSLTVVRMIPVAISLIGSGQSRSTVLFIGWFGPRGIASVLYTLIMIIQLGRDGYEKIISIITLTVLLSIFLHGITAMPFSKLFGKSKLQPEQ